MKWYENYQPSGWNVREKQWNKIRSHMIFPFSPHQQCMKCDYFWLTFPCQVLQQQHNFPLTKNLQMLFCLPSSSSQLAGFTRKTTQHRQTYTSLSKGSSRSYLASFYFLVGSYACTVFINHQTNTFHTLSLHCLHWEEGGSTCGHTRKSCFIACLQKQRQVMLVQTKTQDFTNWR